MVATLMPAIGPRISQLSHSPSRIRAGDADQAGRSQDGTYKLLSGTGAYAGISGSGTYQLSILAIGASSGGKCVQNKPPVAFHQVINASGPVSLP